MTPSSIPKRILMTADTLGGVWTYALDLARFLEPHGVEIALATMGKPLSPEQWDEAGRRPNVEVFESEYKLEWMECAWDDVRRAGDWLLRLEDRLRPDLIHLNGYAHGYLSWDAPVLVVGHSCVLSWHRGVWDSDAPPAWDDYRRIVTRGLQAADMVVAPTQAMLSELERYYGPLPPSRVLPNARSPEAFKPGPKEPIIFTAGRVWDYAKNVGVLASVAHRMPWEVVVAGDQQHPESGVHELADVTILGRIPSSEVADWLSRASIYSLQARYEPFGLSALEAALCGCALVLGDIASLREVWGDAALYVHPNDVDGLADTLNGLIEDRERRTALANAARERAKLYSPERMTQGYLTAYADLLRDRKHRSTGEKIPAAASTDPRSSPPDS